MALCGGRADMITEAFVTRKTVEWLENRGWSILAFDFPQSGTGFVLHPNDSTSKTKGTIIPDIVARKGEVGLLLENKDRFDITDFKKINHLRTTSDFSDSLDTLFGGELPKTMCYGVAFPRISSQIGNAQPHLDKVDFLLTVTRKGEVKVSHTNVGDVF